MICTIGKKPKQVLDTGNKGHPLLPANCLIRHGDSAQFLTYQKQVLQSYIERLYSKSITFKLTTGLTIV
jgi:hypothetical protein